MNNTVRIDSRNNPTSSPSKSPKPSLALLRGSIEQVGEMCPLAKSRSPSSVFGNRSFPKIVSEQERNGISKAITSLLTDPRAATNLKRFPITLGRGVSVTSKETHLHDFLAAWKKPEYKGAMSPEAALFLLVGHKKEEQGQLQIAFMTLLGGYAKDVVRELTQIRNQVVRNNGFSPKLRNQELCREDF